MAAAKITHNPFAKVCGAMAPTLLVVDDNQELLTLLTQLFEDAGYHVLATGKGKLALELALVTPPQCAVVDILLPDMMGFHLAEALHKENPKLPLVFVTGVFKGGKQAGEAKLKYGASDYFEKPFDSQKLLEAVKRLVPVEKKEQAGSIEDAFEVELDIDVEEEEPQDAMELTGRIRVTAQDNISAELRGAPLTAQATSKGQSGEVRKAPVSKPAAAAPPKVASPTSRRGELQDNLPSLITAFYQSGQSGELGVQRGKVKKVVYFEKGQPIFAMSNLVTDRFGQFLVRVGKIKPEQLQDAAAVATQTKRRTGDVLIERGLLKDTERLYFVGQQVKAIIYSIFGWEDGTYVMSFRDKAGAEAIKLDAHPANLIFRGVKKLYKPERLRRLVRPEDRLMPSSQPAYQLNEIALEKWEIDLMPKIDGTRTVGELIALANRPENLLYSSLAALLSMSILEPRL
jgi:FixJ family two-component response regulator